VSAVTAEDGGTGADRIAAALSALGATHVFGLPGTQNAGLFTRLERHGVRGVLATHEASAAFMANGYARATGRPGVVLTIPGPGFLFALAGVGEARLDSVPLVLVTGAPPDADDGRRFLHQALDQAGVAGPLVKEVVEVDRVDAIEGSLRRAFQVALAAGPGPVLVHLRSGLLYERPEGRRPAEMPAGAATATGTPIATGEAVGHARAGARVDQDWRAPLADLVRSAKRPVLFVGAGAVGAADAVREVAERWPAPVFTTLSGRGILPEDHPRALGFDADRGGLGALNELLARADLVLAVGCRMSHNGTAGFGLALPADRLVHVDRDPDALGPNYPAGLLVEADASDAFAVVLDALDAGASASWDGATIDDVRLGIRTPAPPRTPEPAFRSVDGRTPRAFFAALRRALPRNGIVVTDSGLHQVMTRRYLDVLAPAGLLAPSDLQSMGFGVPAAVGAALGAAGRPVVAVVGDGGFLMTAMDLLCAKREGVTLPVVVFNDGHLNLIRLQQLREEGAEAAVALGTPDLEGLARAMDVAHDLVEGDPAATIRAALARPGPTLVEVRLGDSAAIRVARAGGRARAGVRRTLGRRLIERMKGWLGR